MSSTERAGADAGALEIRHLLAAPNPALARAARRLSSTLPHGVAPSAAGTPHLVVERGMVEAVQQIRRSYRRLHAQIVGIETNRRSAKARVLRALQELDSSFTTLLQSLDARGLSRGSRLAHEAHAHQTHAAGELQHAFEELA